MKTALFTSLFCVAVALDALTAINASAAVLYSQAPVDPGNLVGQTGQTKPFYSSREDVTDPADPTRSKVYDNFTLQVDSLITDLHWYGTYDRDFVTPRSAIDFRIEFFGSTGTAPDIAGGALYSNVFDAGTVGVNDGTQVSEIATGAQIVDGDGVNRAQFRYDLDPLVPSFAATAGTEYWLAITALQAFDHPTLPDPNWAWQIGALGDGVAYQFMADPADPFDGLIDTDMAFTLTGPMAGVIPEPGSVAIWFATLVGVCGFVAVKKKKRG